MVGTNALAVIAFSALVLLAAHLAHGAFPSKRILRAYP
jgi:hypothetical protein